MAIFYAYIYALLFVFFTQAMFLCIASLSEPLPRLFKKSLRATLTTAEETTCIYIGIPEYRKNLKTIIHALSSTYIK